VVNAQLVSNQLNVAISNVYRYLDPLVEAKIIVEFTDQARNRAWLAPEVLSALDAFAERAGRRALLA
jgi:Fe2+ or Zn2+ uptake regulation protein